MTPNADGEHDNGETHSGNEDPLDRKNMDC
jgi:hypothetical protein